MFSRRIQQRARQLVAFIIKPLARLGVTPNMLTFLGFLLSILTATVLAQGYVVIGGVLVLFAGIFDMFDGAMARVRNAATTFGAFFDSTLDRYSESIILFGLLYYVLQRPGLHDALWPFPDEQLWMITSIFIAAVGSLMVSYTKARAEGLGLECKTGLLARPERVVILAAGLLTGTTIWALTLLAILSHVTTVERMVHVWRSTRRSALSAATAASVATDDARQLSAESHIPVQDSGATNRHASIELNERRESSVSSVPTGLPPFTGSVHQE